MEFENLIMELERKKNEIDRAIDEYIKKYDGELYEMVDYALRDGKRLRGIVLLLTAQAFNGDYEKALRLAVSAELGHAASLVHDDIIDKSTERRRKPTLWKKYGIERAVILPHLLISESLEIARKEGPEFLRVGLETWSKASMGEYLDIMAMDSKNWPNIDYLKLIALKSGSLFEGAAEIGALCSEEGKKVLGDAKRYGMALGIAYQLTDDLIGYLNEKEGGGSQDLFSYYIKREIGESIDLSLVIGFLVFKVMKEFDIIRTSVLFEKSEYLKLFPIFSVLEIMKENGDLYSLVKEVLGSYL